MSSDSSGIREMIAKQYDRDLSGKNGALARFDAINELIDAKVNKGAIFSSSDETSITGANGFFSISSPPPRPTKKTPIPKPPDVPLLWELTIEDADSAEVSIKCAKILKDASNLSETLPIQNEEEVFSVETGDKIFLKITTTFIDEQFVTEVSLEKNATWEDYPARYEITNEGNDAIFTAYYYPLYYFDDISDDDSITIISEELYAHRVCENSHFELIWAIYQKGTDAALTVPKLIASHAPLPAPQ